MYEISFSKVMNFLRNWQLTNCLYVYEVKVKVFEILMSHKDRAMSEVVIIDHFE